MSTPSRLGATLLGASLALCLAACGGATQQSAQHAPIVQEQADDSTATVAVEVDGVTLEPAIYNMVTYGTKDTAAAVDEYLNSGYTAAAYQLVLFGDGSGLLYEGRSFRGLVFGEEGITVEGTPATLSEDEQRFVLTVDDIDMVFDYASATPSTRQVNTALAGAYVEHDEDGAVLDRMRLHDDGTGTYHAAGGTSNALHWGTDPVFGHEYVIVDGTTYRFTYRRDSANGAGYDITILDTKRTLLVPAED